ncbi:unnamed protein product [Acidithrix sp. C25]|nr:unnamed protein product [Acidithrix sp. C25]
MERFFNLGKFKNIFPNISTIGNNALRSTLVDRLSFLHQRCSSKE